MEDGILPESEIAEVVEQLRVVLQHQICPRERRVLRLRANVEQIKPPDVGWDASLARIIAKHADAATL